MQSKNGPGEYNYWDINPADNQVYDLSAGLPLKVVGQPAKVTDVKGWLHHQALIDDAGNVYAWGDNSSGQCGIGTSGGTVATPTQIKVDAYGNPFTGIIAVRPYANGAGAKGLGYGTAFVKADGTCWLCGNTQSGMQGDGTAGSLAQTRPIKVPLPAGVIAKQFDVGLTCNVLDQNGQIWTWGGQVGQYWPPYLLAQGTDTPDPTRPGKLIQAYPAIAMCAGGLFSYAILQMPTGPSVIGWAFYTQYLGLPANVGKNTPFVLDKVLNLPGPVAKINMNTVATYAILQDGRAFAWGDNACGFIGNGTELDFSTYKVPYDWDWGIMELYQPPVQIGVGLTFAEFSTSLGDAFYCYATDTNGQRYSWGRNKGGVLGNGVISADPTGNETANLPNSWDVAGMTPISPYTLTAAVPTPSPLNKKPGPLPPAIAPSAVTITGPTGPLVGTAPLVPINYWLWSQQSGPTAALIVLPWSPTPMLQNLVPGTYIFQAKMTDNNWNVFYQQVTVTVLPIAPPPPPPPPPPALKTVTGLELVLGDGTTVPIPVKDAKFTFSDGSTQ